MSEEYDMARLPLADQQMLIDVHVRARRDFSELLAQHGRRTGLPTALATLRVAILERELIPIVTAMATRETPVACARGCASCCTILVETTPDESLALALELVRTLDADRLSAVETRAVAKATRSLGLDPKPRQALRIQCALLDQATGACMVHRVRPAACQGYLSLDRGRCEADHFGAAVAIPRPVAADFIRDAVISAQQIVLEAAGLSQRRIELTQGLLFARQDFDLEAKWLAGEAFWQPPD